jgi:hypothetical protein
LKICTIEGNINSKKTQARLGYGLKSFLHHE